MVKISKFLSLVLRHQPDKIGLMLDTAGWVSVEELLEACQRHRFPLTKSKLEEVIAGNDKRRFSFSDDRLRIRANQGHSVYYRYYHPGHHNVAAHYGIRTERYKLIYFNKLDQWELYDLKNDQVEMRNVYADPANAGLVTKLKTEMYRLKKDLKDEDQFQENLPRDDVGGGMARARP